MTITDLISYLLDNGCRDVLIAHTPEGKLFVQVSHGIGTGPEGNSTLIKYQRAGQPLVEMLEAIKRDVIYCGELQTKVIQLKRP